MTGRGIRGLFTTRQLAIRYSFFFSFFCTSSAKCRRTNKGNNSKRRGEIYRGVRRIRGLRPRRHRANRQTMTGHKRATWSGRSSAGTNDNRLSIPTRFVLGNKGNALYRNGKAYGDNGRGRRRRRCTCGITRPRALGCFKSNSRRREETYLRNIQIATERKGRDEGGRRANRSYGNDVGGFSVFHKFLGKGVLFRVKARDRRGTRDGKREMRRLPRDDGGNRP